MHHFLPQLDNTADLPATDNKPLSSGKFNPTDAQQAAITALQDIIKIDSVNDHEK